MCENRAEIKEKTDSAVVKWFCFETPDSVEILSSKLSNVKYIALLKIHYILSVVIPFNDMTVNCIDFEENTLEIQIKAEKLDSIVEDIDSLEFDLN